MLSKEELLKKIEAGNFIQNNGTVLRTINILRHTYNKLGTIKMALDDMPEDEMLDCVNYLYESDYIHLRDINTKLDSSLADNDYKSLEAKLTAKGIQLLAGKLKDECIIV